MADNDTTETEPKKSKKKLIIIIVAALLALSLAGGAAYFFLMGGDETEEMAEEVDTDIQQDAIYVKLRTLDGRPMFVASLVSASGSRHYMQIFAEAKTRDLQVETILNEHMPLIVARLNSLFTTANPDELRRVEGIKNLQQQATDLLNRLVMDRGGPAGVEMVLFTDFVMQ